MAVGKVKDSWFIWALLVVAAVFAVMALRGPKPKEEPVSPVSGATVVNKVAVEPPPVSPEAGIKPDHSVADMKEIVDKKPAESVVVAPQSVQATDRFAVQVYSFKEKARAEAALKALKDKNYKAYILVSDLGARGVWYRVRVGAFATELEAQKALEAITKDFKSGIIVTE